MSKTAEPTTSKCAGSGQPWQTGGKCPECKRTATGLINLFHVPARRGDNSLAPRVPDHPNAAENTVVPTLKPVVAQEEAEASVLNGTRTSDRPTPPPRRASRMKAASKPLAEKLAKPAPTRGKRALAAVPEPKPAKKVPAVKDPLLKPFTKTITDYLVWLEKQTGSFDKMDAHRLAGMAISMYGKYQTSDERRAQRAGGAS
jgi:hypothetical protein